MQNEDLLDKTASKQLTLEQEYEMQKTWYQDDDSKELQTVFNFYLESHIHVMYQICG